jgi:uncharacterized protein (TIGR04255 family)
MSPDGAAHQVVGEKLAVSDDADRHWRVTLSGQFVSLETSRYTSRSDFIERAARLIDAVTEVYKPVALDRVGVRYVNRIEDENLLSRLESLVEPPFLVGHQVPHEGSRVVHSLCDTLYAAGEVMLQGRWGTLPSGVAVDPLLPPPEKRYWTLDIDAYKQVSRRYVSSSIVADIAELATHAHSFFRAAVKPDFLRAFGGSP